MTGPVRHRALAAEIERQLTPSRSHIFGDVARPPVHLTAAQWQAVATALRDEVGVAPDVPSIDPECTETEFVVLSAVRYCLGRPVAAVRPCIAWLRAHWPRFREDQRAEVIAEVVRFIAAEEAQAREAGWASDPEPWRDFVAWARTGEERDGARRALAALARYRLEILQRGPRAYSDRDTQIRALQRRGLVEEAGPLRGDGRRLWRITPAGRAALEEPDPA